MMIIKTIIMMFLAVFSSRSHRPVRRLGGIMCCSSHEDNTRMEARAKSAHGEGKEAEEEEKGGG